MIEKKVIEQNCDAFYWVENILAQYKDYYLSKEEIYAEMPKDLSGVPQVTISALENALRNLARMGHINIEYHQGRRYFGYREERKR